uniref:ABC transporter domain-containing protein n=1 Tax=Ananas comosus var. bracteatus TaxID=296719 RepID=A0A6V7NEQ0_ANACO|nr:unnamed protein product [Ananas comosus var. bracteatus]
MAHPGSRNEPESFGIELEEARRSMESSFRAAAASFRRSFSSARREGDDDDEYELKWAAIERLDTFDRLRTSLFDHPIDAIDGDGEKKEKRATDVTKLGALERRLFIENLIKHIENDNLRLLQKQRERIDRVNVQLPTIEVRYENLCVEADCEVVQGKPYPPYGTLPKVLFCFHGTGSFQNDGLKSSRSQIRILKDVTGIIKPSRQVLLVKDLDFIFRPPGCGKTTLLLALSGKLDKSLKVTGEIHYNGFRLDEFVPEKTSAYISQYDLHIPEMTVRETLDFSARFQGVGSRAEIMKEVIRREKEAGIVPDPDIDTYMKAISVEGLERSLQTEYVMKIMGLDICADTMIGDAMRRGISGGEKKRLTTGEMIVGPTKALFMDEISTGLDSSTTFQIVSCLRQLTHITESTVLVSLLQPAPETYDLFDDVILMAEGKIVYHGPRTDILNYFEVCSFKCPERKGAADFLQEVLSRKDQKQYWNRPDENYGYVTVDQFCEKFKAHQAGQSLTEELSKPYDKSKCPKNSLSFSIYSLSKWELLKACVAREVLLMKRNSFIYIFKAVQVDPYTFFHSVFLAVMKLMDKMIDYLFIAARDSCDDYRNCVSTYAYGVDTLHSNYYMGSLFYALLLLMVNGFPELAMTVSRLPVFYKQRDFYFYPAWAYAIPATILKIPVSIVESIIWTSITYYLIGYSPQASRFFRQLLLLFFVHVMSLSLFRVVASYFQTVVASTLGGTFALLLILLFGGFLLPRPSIPSWLKWGFWTSPLTYTEIGLAVNEFLAPRWQKLLPSNITIGKQVLITRGLNYSGYYYWIAIGALFGFVVLFNIGFTLSLTFKRPLGASRAIISREKLSQLQGKDVGTKKHSTDNTTNLSTTRSTEPKTTGKMVLPFIPLTVAFKDVNYYVDSPAVRNERTRLYRKKLQLLHNITGAFQPGVLTALMGVTGAGKTTLLDVLSAGWNQRRTGRATGINGLSTEQRKRLTIAVELISNPSVIFMDEPTSGLDARAAAIVMRAVKNVAETGRTVVCTIHQPSIDIFEAFDELILMKRGGELIYAGPLGRHSCKVIEYFEGISGVPKIRNSYNPATWMLDVTTTSFENQLGVDFAKIYKESSLYKENMALVERLSIPSADSKQLSFPTRFAQNFWVQFKACLWKQYLSYWRSPSYNSVRITFVLVSSIVFAVLFQNHANNINNQQDLFNILGYMYAGTIFTGINCCSSVIPFIAIERTVVYRENFAGMYSPWAYSFAQVVIEFPYVFGLVVLFMIITYPAIGFTWTASKFLWFFYIMFCTLLYFIYLGMMLTSLTPNVQVASILASVFYTLLNLFSGFIVPSPEIPKWWIWLYYICPTSWTLDGLFSSQYGDVDKEVTVFEETQPISSFIESYFEFHHDRLWSVAIVLIAFPLVFATLFAYFIGKLNFQRR